LSQPAARRQTPWPACRKISRAGGADLALNDRRVRKATVMWPA